jgi:DNA helicase-2/ATP-dependent DNA helicase PcrA
VKSYEGERCISFGDIAVLFRLNIQGNVLEEAFSRAGIPFVRSGETGLIYRHPAGLIYRFLQAFLYPEQDHYQTVYAEANPDASALLKKAREGGVSFRHSPLDAIRRAISLHNLEDTPDEETEVLNRLLDYAGDHPGDLRSFLDALSLERGIDHAFLLGDRVALMSLHAAKGLEWPAVFITGCEDQLLPCSLFGDRDEQEERRLFYVGMTRARERIVLSWAMRRTIGNRVLPAKPSPFLQDIPKDFTHPLERQPPKPRAHKQLGFFD